MRHNDFHQRTKILLALCFELLLPIAIAQFSSGSYLVEVAIYYEPGQISPEGLDRMRNAAGAQPSSGFPFVNAEFWRVPKDRLSLLASAASKEHAWIDPVPVSELFEREPRDFLTALRERAFPRRDQRAVTLQFPGFRTRFAYLAGRWIDAYADASYPLDVPLRPRSRSVVFVDENGTPETADVTSLTVFSPTTYAYHVRLPSGAEGDIHVSPDGETGAIAEADQSTLLMFAAGGNTSLGEIVRAGSDSDHPHRREYRGHPAAAFADAEPYLPRPNSQLRCTPDQGISAVSLKVKLAYTTDAWRMIASKGGLAPDGAAHAPADESTVMRNFGQDLEATLDTVFKSVNFGSKAIPIPLSFSVSQVVPVRWEKATSAAATGANGMQIAAPADFAFWLRDQLLTPQNTLEQPLRDLMTTTEPGSYADMVVLLVGDSFKGTADGQPGFFGLSGGVRTQPNASFSIVRADAALANYTAAHEVAHLLGARHQVFYRCPNAARGNDCSDNVCQCDVDENRQDQIDDAELSPVDPVSGVATNRAYIGLIASAAQRYGTVTSSNTLTTDYFPTPPVLRLPILAEAGDKTDAGWTAGDKEHSERDAITAFAPCVLKRRQVGGGPTHPGSQNPERHVGTSGADAEPRLHPREPTLCNSSDSCGRDTFNRLSYPIYFDSGSSRIRCDEQSRLPDLVTFLRAQRARALYVEGFADTQPPKSQLLPAERYNYELARRRAFVVTSVLLEGMRSSSICYIGHGSHLLSVPTDAGHALWRNRRVEVRWSLECPAHDDRLCAELRESCVTPGSPEATAIKQAVANVGNECEGEETGVK